MSLLICRHLSRWNITRKSLNHHQFSYISFILFWVDAEKQTHNAIATCFAKLDSLTIILSPHFLTSQGARLVATVQGWRSQEPLAAPRDAVRSAQVAAPLAAAVAERTSAIVPGHVVSTREEGWSSTGLSWCLPKWLDIKGTTCSPQLSEVTKTGPKILHNFVRTIWDMSFWILVSNLCCFYHLYLYLLLT